MLVKPVDAKPNFVECLFSIFLKSNYSKFQLDSKQRAIALWLPSIILKQVSASYKNCLKGCDGLLFQLLSCHPPYSVISKMNITPLSRNKSK